MFLTILVKCDKCRRWFCPGLPEIMPKFENLRNCLIPKLLIFFRRGMSSIHSGLMKYVYSYIYHGTRCQENVLTRRNDKCYVERQRRKRR